MIQHVSKVTSTCYYHLRRLHQIRSYISRETVIQLAMSLVIYRIDYCNCVLVGLPASKLAPLQRVQNAAARIILGLSRRFKKIPYYFQSSYNRAQYLPRTFLVSGSQRRQLRSSAVRSAVVFRTRTQFGRRTFSVCGPDIWNNLPVNIRLSDSHAAFRRAINTHLLALLLFSLLLVYGWTFALHIRSVSCL